MTVSQGLILAGVLVSSLLLGGCDRLALLLGITDPFADYRDSSVNFIAASGLDQYDLTTGAPDPLYPTDVTKGHANPGYLTPKKWTWAWRGAPDADSASGFTYMNLASVGPVGTGAPAGLDENAAVYRLELKNLIQGGDFEGVNADVAKLPGNGWIAGSTVIAAVGTFSGSIHGSSLGVAIPRLTSNDLYAGFRFSLGSLPDALSVPAPHAYAMYYFANSPSSFNYQVSRAGTFDTGKDLLFVPLTFNSLVEDRFESLLWTPDSPNELIFGSSSSPNDLIFDDIRVLRTDLEYRLRLLLAPSDTTPALTHGQGWVFSVWARKPLGRYFVNEASATEPYAARHITLRMRQLVKTGSNSDLDSAADKFSIEVNPSWTRHILSLKPASTLDFSADSAVPVLELSITPFDEAAPEPGIVEIAAPELHFYLNGYQ